MVLGRPIRVDFAAEEKRNIDDRNRGPARRGGSSAGGRFREGEGDDRYGRDDRGGRYGRDEGGGLCTFLFFLRIFEFI